MDTGSVLLGWATYLIATASPGPATLAIMSISASHGRLAGLQLASGVMCGSLFWGLCAAFGLATLMSQFSGLFLAVKIAGGCYLIWLAIKSFRIVFKQLEEIQVQKPSKTKKFVLQGLAIHLTNPKAVLAWVAIYSVGVQPGASVSQIAIMFLGCALLGVVVFFGYAILFSTYGAQSAYAAAKRPIHLALGSLFGFAGLKLILERNQS